jgi:glycosyltransferase involved in cell wall biosynthesis
VADPPDHKQISVVRVISRLNIGGPAIQAITLTKLLEERGYRTELVRGREGAREGTMDDLAQAMGVVPTLLAPMRREVGPADAVALAGLVRILRRQRPRLVHTHAAKAGTVGRLAALVPGRGRPQAIVHTFHGHSLEGYFGRARQRVFLALERFLAKRTTQLVAVSDEVRDDLVRLGVAPSEAIRVIPLGFDLARFAPSDERAAAARRFRERLAIGPDERVVTLIARLAPIKRVDRFLRAGRLLAGRNGEAVRFVVVGDGELHDELRASEDAQALGDAVAWAGFERDIPAVCGASDVVVLTSDLEGTPVSLIEAQAAALPVVSTRVGGVPAVVLDGETGILVERDDDAGLAAAVAQLLETPERAREMGERGRAHVLERFTVDRLVDDLDRLYRELLGLPALPAQEHL